MYISSAKSRSSSISNMVQLIPACLFFMVSSMILSMQSVKILLFVLFCSVSLCIGLSLWLREASYPYTCFCLKCLLFWNWIKRSVAGLLVPLLTSISSVKFCQDGRRPNFLGLRKLCIYLINACCFSTFLAIAIDNTFLVSPFSG